MAHILCINCREPCEGRRTYTWISREEQHIDIAQIIIEELIARQNEPTDVICRPCWQRAERTFHRRIHEVREDDDVLPDEPIQQQSRNHTTLTLAGFVRTPNSTTYCIFEHCQNITRLRIPNDIIIRMIGRYNLLIPENARVCEEHLAQNLWHTLPLQDNLIEDFTASEIVNALTIMRNHITTDVLNFETYEVINENEFHTWTGLTHEQFSNLLVNTSSLNNNRQKKTILAAVLAKLRTGDSNARLALVFRTSESRFQRMLALAVRTKSSNGLVQYNNIQTTAEATRFRAAIACETASFEKLDVLRSTFGPCFNPVGQNRPGAVKPFDISNAPVVLVNSVLSK
ncbi:hypothetical protein ACJJTC_002336 [Scirpophaga incertulas]